jgi:dTDP-glucose pyrophosphorylase
MAAMTGPTLVILGAGRARRYGGVKQLAPIGVHDEAVIDLIASDAYSSGFERIVIVINPDTGPQIREHVAANWPSHAPVDFAIQEVPLGTVHAVLAAREHVGADTPFGVANADDLYGLFAMAALGSHLRHEGTNCLVGFRLDRALVGELPVTRGICDVHKGRLTGIIERRQVHLEDGDFFARTASPRTSWSPTLGSR